MTATQGAQGDHDLVGALATSLRSIRHVDLAPVPGRDVRAVGADTIACEVSLKDEVAGPAPGHEIHWLPNNILILERVANLELVSRRCLFVAMPLRIEHGSGSPPRPIAYCMNA